MPASVRLHFVLVQTISLIKFRLSIIITVDPFFAYDNSYDGPIVLWIGEIHLYGIEYRDTFARYLSWKKF